MAMKGRQKNTLAPGSRLHNISLREENVGRKHANPLAVLKLQHLQRLAIWAGGEASVSPLAAHFGRMLAASAEHEGIPLDRSIVSCQSLLTYWVKLAIYYYLNCVPKKGMQIYITSSTDDVTSTPEYGDCMYLEADKFQKCIEGKRNATSVSN